MANLNIQNVAYPWDGHEELNEGEIPTENNPIASYVNILQCHKAGMKYLYLSRA